MLGPAVNTLVVVVCSLAGVFMVRGIPPRFEETIKKAVGLSILYVGLKGALEGQNILLLIMSVVSGGILGELIDIDKQMNRLGLWAEKRLGRKEEGGGKFAQGFVSASILFCTGSMAIVGSIQSGLQGNHETLFAKSILDGVMSLVFAASFGIGVLFSAIPVLIYQGGIALASLAIRDYLSEEVIREMSAAGNLLVAALGFNFLVPESKAAGFSAIKVANLIPGIFIPGVYLTLERLFRP
jgi:uncharacterized membrane protein YqgA involved in biofilm formation